MLRLLFGLLVLAACSVYVLDIGGARRPMFDTYIGVVQWAVQDVVQDVQDSVAPTPSPSPVTAPVP